MFPRGRCGKPAFLPADCNTRGLAQHPRDHGRRGSAGAHPGRSAEHVPTGLHSALPLPLAQHVRAARGGRRAARGAVAEDSREVREEVGLGLHGCQAERGLRGSADPRARGPAGPAARRKHAPGGLRPEVAQRRRRSDRHQSRGQDPKGVGHRLHPGLVPGTHRGLQGRLERGQDPGRRDRDPEVAAKVGRRLGRMRRARSDFRGQDLGKAGEARADGGGGAQRAVHRRVRGSGRAGRGLHRHPGGAPAGFRGRALRRRLEGHDGAASIRRSAEGQGQARHSDSGRRSGSDAGAGRHEVDRRVSCRCTAQPAQGGALQVPTELARADRAGLHTNVVAQRVHLQTRRRGRLCRG
mmetsp:Transcript_105515/g.297194  ORF Transcript_105515/g.297194 Transcript_105515/m.297194 type:complete len:353 (-) Transcript_105515:243-1301(-)